jgi:DNA-binding HxlR family transcriptional regulator
MWTGRLALPSLFFVLAVPAAGDYMGRMSVSYRQFCPIAKASEIFATRWTPLIVRELMAGVHSFNDIHRGVPLISRAVLVARLRELEDHGVIERRPRADGAGHEYWLTPAGDGAAPAAIDDLVNENHRVGTHALAEIVGEQVRGLMDDLLLLGRAQRALGDLEVRERHGDLRGWHIGRKERNVIVATVDGFVGAPGKLAVEEENGLCCRTLLRFTEMGFDEP